MKSILKKIPTRLQGKIVERQESCKICNEKMGMQIGEVEYWDIQHCKIIKCKKCGLAQLDPMLTTEQTAKGCLAYYVEESLRCSPKEQERNLLRNFRRGVVFGFSLKRKNISPENVLELGPGSGYFASGLQFVFPNAQITVMDVNKEVLRLIAHHHQFKTIETALEDYLPELGSKFDLIIARDILEHVEDISKVIVNVKSYCKDKGLFHFITPNGHEDVWKHYLAYRYLDSPSELLINHVNYFDGEGLLNFLLKNNFSPISYYTYKLKTTRRGQGWKVNNKLMASAPRMLSADHYIDKAHEIRQLNFDKRKVLNKWYIGTKRKFITHLVSSFHHASIITVSPKLNVGHEIFGLFKLNKSSRVDYPTSGN